MCWITAGSERVRGAGVGCGCGTRLPVCRWLHPRRPPERRTPRDPPCCRCPRLWRVPRWCRQRMREPRSRGRRARPWQRQGREGLRADRRRPGAGSGGGGCGDWREGGRTGGARGNGATYRPLQPGGERQARRVGGRRHPLGVARGGGEGEEDGCWQQARSSLQFPVCRQLP